jgi:radial spoke head protein 4A
MASSSMWLHYTPSILNQGRTKHADPTPRQG